MITTYHLQLENICNQNANEIKELFYLLLSVNFQNIPYLINY